MNKTVKILNLYPKAMNVYGDQGNVLALSTRIQQYGYVPQIIDYNVGDEFTAEIDIVIGGGGQDSGQNAIQADLLKIGPHLRKLARDDVPMLVVCGLYQLFGHYFATDTGEKIRGIEIFDMTTVAGGKRIVGNVVANSADFGTIVGFENHSGLTTLHDGLDSLATVRKGVGNSLVSHSEGARYNNVIGTYLHGPILPKNPLIMDFLVATAVKYKYSEELMCGLIDDTLALLAQNVAARRPR